MKKTIFIFTSLLIILLSISAVLSACSSNLPVTPTTSLIEPTSINIENNINETAIIQEPVYVSTTTAAITTSSEATLQPTQADIIIPSPTATASLAVEKENAPMIYTFPTPGPHPISLWRPPLYEVPWSPGPYDHFFFVRPIAADEVNWPLPDYRYGGIFFSSDIVHTGIDIVATRGTPVLASGPGIIKWAGTGLYFGAYNPQDPYGLAVVIKHDFGYQGNELYTVYAHMDRIDVIKGQRVETGSQLGIVGNTGFTTGPHLHFEVRIGKNDFFVTRNPELWLAPPQGWGVLVGKMMNARSGLIDRHSVYVISKEDESRLKVITYGHSTVNSDDYYRENLVLSDLPAGDYTIEFNYLGKTYQQDITINPGSISYFTYHAKTGFSTELPPLPDDITSWQPPATTIQ